MTNIKRIFATIMLIAFIAVALLSYQGVGNKMMAVNAETASATDDERICQDIKEDAKFSTNEILVVLDAETSRLDGIIPESIDCMGYESVEDLTKINVPSTELEKYYGSHSFHQIISVELTDKTEDGVLEAVNKLQNADGVMYAGPDYVEQADDVETIYKTGELEGTENPNDEYFDDLWGLSDDYGIGAVSAWRITQGESNVRVGVIDSGIVEHEDLSNVAEGYDFYNEDTDTADAESDHGTHVAGTIAAVANNESGVAGVAPGVTLVPLQVANDDGTYNDSDVIEAINYATSLWGTAEQISVLNHSISGFGDSIAKLSAIGNYPGLFVWSAGNDSECVDDYSTIEQFELDNLISVGAIKSSGSIASYSNYGDGVDIFAPGTDICSTVFDNDYDTKKGTSMAAPHVSGIAALLLSLDDDLTAGELKEIIVGGAIPLSYTKSGTTYSSGRASAIEAINFYYDENVPEYVEFELTGKTSAGWQVALINNNEYSIDVAYNTKMCFESDAAEFSDLSDVEVITVSSNGSESVTISENGTAGYIAASVGYTLQGNNYRRISYANGLTKSGTEYSLDTPSHNIVSVLNYAELDADPEYLTFAIEGKSGNLWTIEITNLNTYAVNITYNSKMCFSGDAQDYDGCTDLVNIVIPAESAQAVYISTNGLAGYITARIDYCHQGVAYSAVTYAKNLKKNESDATEYNVRIMHL